MFYNDSPSYANDFIMFGEIKYLWQFIIIFLNNSCYIYDILAYLCLTVRKILIVFYITIVIEKKKEKKIKIKSNW